MFTGMDSLWEAAFTPPEWSGISPVTVTMLSPVAREVSCCSQRGDPRVRTMEGFLKLEREIYQYFLRATICAGVHTIVIIYLFSPSF